VTCRSRYRRPIIRSRLTSFAPKRTVRGYSETPEKPPKETLDNPKRTQEDTKRTSNKIREEPQRDIREAQENLKATSKRQYRELNISMGFIFQQRSSFSCRVVHAPFEERNNKKRVNEWWMIITSYGGEA
jgi:hypothetical protein